MKFGVADYGLSVWEGGLLDYGYRLERLKAIGFQGVERLEAVSASDALEKSAAFHRLGMDFATCRGPNARVNIEWTAGLGKGYVWAPVGGRADDFDKYIRQVNFFCDICERWGIKAALHNHLGSRIESEEELERFLKDCPKAGLVFDTAHHAGAGGDSVKIAEKYADRVVALHLKDYELLNPALGLDKWPERLRFCALGVGEMGLDNAAVLKAVVKRGFDGWVHVEQDCHLRDPYEDLAGSRQYIKKNAGL